MNVEQENWYVKAGIRQRWTPLGHTVLYGEYATSDLELDGLNNDRELDQWGLGVVQEVDAAAMSLWLSYKHFEAEDDALVTDPDDFDLIKFGALINF